MGFTIEWLDEKLHIYNITLADPFTSEDQDRFFNEFFRFMDDGPNPMFGVFDISQWSQSGATGLYDPRFRRMADYRKKIRVIMMVTTNRLSIAMGQLGATIAGYRDWIQFEPSRSKAIKHLRKRAAQELHLADGRFE
jgi:hypothetical protein